MWVNMPYMDPMGYETLLCFFCGSVFFLTVAASTTPPSHRTELLVESHGSSPPWARRDRWPVSRCGFTHIQLSQGAPGNKQVNLQKLPGGFVQLRYSDDKLNKLSLAYPFFLELDWRSERKKHTHKFSCTKAHGKSSQSCPCVNTFHVFS